MPKIKAHINPKLLTFAREQMGYEIPEIAGKLYVSEEQWEKWETGEKQPTIRQLKDIAYKLDRTPTFFYLYEPPEEPEASSKSYDEENDLSEIGQSFIHELKPKRCYSFKAKISKISRGKPSPIDSDDIEM